MFKLLDCNNFWSPSGGGVRRYHLEKMDYYKSRTDVEYVFIMHDKDTYTEQIGEYTYIEHLKVPKVMGNWEYRYLLKKGPIEPLILKHQQDVIEVGSPYFMPKIINKIKRRNQLSSKVFGFWHADFPVTYVKRFFENAPFDLAVKAEAAAWRFARKHYNQMDGVIVASEVILERMSANRLENLHFAPLGVNNELFNPNKQNTALISELKAGNQDRLILFFPHRLSKEKGLHTLLKAYEILMDLIEIPPALVIAGTGPYQNLVEEAAKKFEHVQFKGFIKSKLEMAEYYASADLGFALSSWETFGLSLVEALSSGMPLIAAGDGAAREHVEKSKAGMILNKVTPENLVNAILQFSKMNTHDLSAKARRYADDLSWRHCFDLQLKIYQEAASANH